MVKNAGKDNTGPDTVGTIDGRRVGTTVGGFVGRKVVGDLETVGDRVTAVGRRE